MLWVSSGNRQNKMNIVVCIKQVPETTEVKINPETNTLIREGVKSIINPFDMYAASYLKFPASFIASALT